MESCVPAQGFNVLHLPFPGNAQAAQGAVSLITPAVTCRPLRISQDLLRGLHMSGAQGFVAEIQDIVASNSQQKHQQGYCIVSDRTVCPSTNS